MPENNAVIGISWEPRLPGFSSISAKTENSSSHNAETSALYKASSELIDGLFVLPNDPKRLKKLLKKQIKDTAGKNWYKVSVSSIFIWFLLTPELKKDLQLLKLRSAIDPTRHYKKESAEEFYSGRLTKKERKATLADELLSDRNLGAYRKRKVRQIEEVTDQAGWPSGREVAVSYTSMQWLERKRHTDGLVNARHLT
ncbi:Hypothetical predicted protein [Olea europaea subsp. europaea]|uniref:Fcf2 pre-rRNA processing C-terminal domain-containing protein n=1 Tax=Olea europaea subsp. europaea TaxID=158383 RepID=A0A8S0R417_OLEEU|nr:Hypothetical predicted protein [Olea europaea subsp. europaea]